MAESSADGKKTLWEMEKLLVTSNFSFSPQCFEKACFPGASKGVIVWEWVKVRYNLIDNITEVSMKVAFKHKLIK